MTDSAVARVRPSRAITVVIANESRSVPTARIVSHAVQSDCARDVVHARTQREYERNHHGRRAEVGAKLTVEGSVEGLNLKEFFLLLSSTGLAYRRCELIRVNGTEIEVRFLKARSKAVNTRSSNREERMAS